MNVNDSLWLGRCLTRDGFEETSFEEASIYFVNTCSVREKPEQKLYSLLGSIRQKTQNDPRILIAVGGCVAQQLGEELFRRFPQVRLVFGTDGVANAPQALRRLLADPDSRISLLDFCDIYPERQSAPPRPGSPASPCAFVNIMQGCNNFCAYCIVPYTRGPQKSRAPHAVLEECRRLLDEGTRDLTLLGQNVNAFGLDRPGDDFSFTRLLYEIASLPGLERLHFVTPHPKDFSPETIQAFGELPNLSPRLHLPLQSGSDRILKRMGRKYDAATYRALVHELRAARSDIALSTDIIVGFPGETEDDFQATLDMVEETGFASSFSFCYSERPGTAASTFADQLPLQVKLERLHRLQQLQEKLTRSFLEGQIGKRLVVLLESPSRMTAQDGSSWQGRDPYGFVVNVAFPKNASGAVVGRLVPVIIKDAKRNSLFAEPEEKIW